MWCFRLALGFSFERHNQNSIFYPFSNTSPFNQRSLKYQHKNKFAALFLWLQKNCSGPFDRDLDFYQWLFYWTKIHGFIKWLFSNGYFTGPLTMIQVLSNVFLLYHHPWSIDLSIGCSMDNQTRFTALSNGFHLTINSDLKFELNGFCTGPSTVIHVFIKWRFVVHRLWFKVLSNGYLLFVC